MKQPPPGEDWLHEQKFDGYRMFCQIREGHAKFISRNHQDWTNKVNSLLSPATELKVQQVVLDGEVVVLDAKGISSFQALQNAFSNQQDNRLAYFVFDILYLNGFDLTAAWLL